MFKLVKILNSGTNQPEPIRLPAQGGKTYLRGTPVKLVAGTVIKVTSTDVPTHIVMESKTVYGSNQTVLCYAVTPDMIFEAESCDIPSEDMLGLKVDLFTSGDYVAGVSNYEGNSATIYDLMGAKKAGDHVLVRFI